MVAERGEGSHQETRWLQARSPALAGGRGCSVTARNTVHLELWLRGSSDRGTVLGASGREPPATAGAHIAELGVNLMVGRLLSCSRLSCYQHASFPCRCQS